ncbi:hypothetical protein D1007_05134 [Hordeum vulgare]|nr:hypothetical protein D1007_05134 [Hordeum vulgare]
MGFIKEFREVEAHDNKLHVIHTNDLQEMKDTARHYKHHLKSQHNKILGVEVQYTNEPAHEQKAALVQLSVGKTQPVLLFQLPERTNYFDSLGDVSTILIDDYYIDMKYKLTDEDHTRSKRKPLSKKHISYAAKHAYAAHEIWSRITRTQDGLRHAKMEKSKKCTKTSGHYGHRRWTWFRP